MESEQTMGIRQHTTDERKLDFSMYDFLQQAVGVLYIKNAISNYNNLEHHDYQSKDGSIHKFLLQTKLIYTNKAFEAYFAYTDASFKDALRDHFRLNFSLQIMDWVASLKQGKESFSTLVQTGDRWLDVQVNTSHLPPLNGEYAILTISDVTELRSTETRLLVTESKLNSFIRNFPGLLFMKDQSSKFLMVSDSFSSIYTMPVHTIIGKKPNEVWDEVIAKPFLAKDEETLILPEGEYLTFTETIPDNGKDRYFTTYQFPVHAGQETLIGGVCFDVTEDHEARVLLQLTNNELSLRTNELQKQQQQLSRMNSALMESQNELNTIIANKQKLFSVISHDLRSPFQGLLGFTELLEHDFENLSNDRRTAYLGYIKEIALNLHQLIDNLVFWSRSTNSTIDAHNESLSIFSELSHMLAVYQGSFNAKKIKVINSVLPLQQVVADKSMIKSVIGNLISNALRNSKQDGTIWFKGFTDEKFFTLIVESEGCHVTAEQYQTLLGSQDSRQAELTAKELGTGIGLLIVKELIEKMGGTLDIDCTANEGTRVFVTFCV